MRKYNLIYFEQTANTILKFCLFKVFFTEYLRNAVGSQKYFHTAFQFHHFFGCDILQGLALMPPDSPAFLVFFVTEHLTIELWLKLGIFINIQGMSRQV